MTGDVRRQIAEALPEHQSWCHGEAHAECCGAGDCDCGVTAALDRLLPVVDRIARQLAAEELEQWARSFRAVGTAAIRRDNRRVYPQVAEVLEAGARDLRADALTAEPQP